MVDQFLSKAGAQTRAVERRIVGLDLGLVSSSDAHRLAHIDVAVPRLYENAPASSDAAAASTGGGTPRAVPNGCLDQRMGTCSKSQICATCGLGLDGCSGHFGVVRLHLPVFHVGLMKHTLELLHCVCKRCSRVLLEPEQTRPMFAARLRAAAHDRLLAQAVFTTLVSHCKTRGKSCPYCQAPNGPVKKLRTTFRLVHELPATPRKRLSAKSSRDNSPEHSDEEMDEDEEDNSLRNDRLSLLARSIRDNMRLQHQQQQQQDLKGGNAKATADIRAMVSLANQAAVHDLTPLEVLRIFERIPSCDWPLLCMNGDDGARPQDLILQHVVVPPLCTRPSVSMGFGGAAGTNEDDLTALLHHIVTINAWIAVNVERGAPFATIFDMWELLQQEVARYINSDLPGFPKSFTNG
jgi:DNA-directed RNA polymerase III subunit RPC1